MSPRAGSGTGVDVESRVTIRRRAVMPEGGPVGADKSRGMDALSEKVNRLEERAVRLANEEMEQVQRGRALNIITGTPSSTPNAKSQAIGNEANAREER